MKSGAELPIGKSPGSGFIRLYCNGFLGVSTDEVISLYQHKLEEPASSQSSASAPSETTSSHHQVTRPSQRRNWSPSSMAQLIAIAILAAAPGVGGLPYRQSPRLADQNPMPWMPAPPVRTQARLVVAKSTPISHAHKVRLTAQTSSWLRVTSRNQLLFEGILPAGASKEWSGNGPFHFKVGDMCMPSLFWNDQPVDISNGARVVHQRNPHPTAMT